jgi:hypothetical protein
MLLIGIVIGSVSRDAAANSAYDRQARSSDCRLAVWYADDLLARYADAYAAAVQTRRPVPASTWLAIAQRGQAYSVQRGYCYQR